MVEALALEAAKEEIQRKEDEKQRKKQNGSVLLQLRIVKSQLLKNLILVLQ